MDLSQKTLDICKELSTEEMKIEPKIIRASDWFPRAKFDTYMGFKQKKRFNFFREPPIFKLEEKAENIVIITSMSRIYDQKIIEIAKENNFGYNIDTPHEFTVYT